MSKLQQLKECKNNRLQGRGTAMKKKIDKGLTAGMKKEGIPGKEKSIDKGITAGEQKEAVPGPNKKPKTKPKGKRRVKTISRVADTTLKSEFVDKARPENLTTASDMNSYERMKSSGYVVEGASNGKIKWLKEGKKPIITDKDLEPKEQKMVKKSKSMDELASEISISDERKSHAIIHGVNKSRIDDIDDEWADDFEKAEDMESDEDVDSKSKKTIGPEDIKQPNGPTKPDPKERAKTIKMYSDFITPGKK